MENGKITSESFTFFYFIEVSNNFVCYNKTY